MTLTYAVITPAHDEAGNLPRLATSMKAQTVLPQTWAIVENGSTDDTPEIAESLARAHTWIRVVLSGTTPSDERGAPIVHAIHAGLAALGPFPDVVAQLDADLSLPPDYFERLLAELEQDESLGIVSGTCFEEVGGVWRERFATGANVWGAARAYRRECIEQILPLEERTGWDSVDVAEANANGWSTRILRDLRFDHHRPEASRELSRWAAWAAQGRVSHYIGYRPSYIILRAAFRAPRDLAALGLIAGYAREIVRRSPRCAKPGVCAFVRREQRLRDLPRRLGEARGGGRTTR
jgi:glycosyltransferase involved in cell wall biosynthesis